MFQSSKNKKSSQPHLLSPILFYQISKEQHETNGQKLEK